MAAPNAIERRLDALADRWLDFTAGPAVALRWATEPESVSTVGAFVTVQVERAVLGDWFVRAELPFEAGTPYGAALAAFLAGLVADAEAGSTEDRAASGEPDDGLVPWVPPPVVGDDALGFAAVCASLATHHAGLFPVLALVIAPASVSDDDALAAWVRRFVRAPLPPSVRLLLVDPDDAPRYAALAAAEPGLVCSEPVDLDMPAALRELAAQGDPDDPAVPYRQHVVALVEASGTGDRAAVAGSGAAALAIAEAQGWDAHRVAVHMAVGSSDLGAEDAAAALVRFRAARAIGEAAEAAGEPWATPLVLTARTAEATALFTAGRDAEAGVLYQSTAPLAAAAGDDTLTLESWRMAAVCFERTGRPDYAWAAGLRATQAAEAMDGDARRASTLPFVGRDMLRLAEAPGYRAYAPAVRERMASLLGPDWTTLIPTS